MTKEGSAISTTLERPAAAGTGNGGVPARRAVVRWAWRLFRREWRQQLLILALVAVAVAATIIGAAVATNTPPPANAGFGTAQDLATFQPPDPHLAAQIASLRQRFGRVDVIENQTMAIPGSISTFEVRAQDPHGPFGQPMLSLVSGRYPTGPGQVAVTSGVAATFGLRVGSSWHQGGKIWRVAGIAENPQSLLDEFALVQPGQVTAPTQVTVLFDAPRVDPATIGPNVRTPASSSQGNVINPETISIAGLTVGMLLIALVSVGGFTVVAQRRLRSLGMLASLGATDQHVRLVVRANGTVVGAVGAITGAIVGLAAWLAYRPVLEASSHHVIGMFSLPWPVIGLALVLAVIATFLAASRPARAITRLPVVAALSGRPAPPKQVHRSAIPGIILLVLAALVLWRAGSRNGNGASAAGELIAGLIGAVAAVILLSPLCLAGLGRAGRRAPVAIRLALRDLARYRARSGPALAAISVGVLIAVMTCVLAAQRYSNVLDYAGPNLAPGQVIVYTPTAPQAGGPGLGPVGGPGGGAGGRLTAGKLRSLAAGARAIGAALGSRDVIALDEPGSSLQHAAAGRQWTGPLYVATPQLLRAFGIKPSQIDPAADILTMRPGLSTMPKMQFIYGNPFGTRTPPSPRNPVPGGANYLPCPPRACLTHPVIQEVSALPAGTSAPNTVITEHAVRTLHLRAATIGWLIQAAQPPTTAQIRQARLTAGGAGMTLETRSSVPTSAEILTWATGFGIVLSLCILAMAVGLVRSETAGELRTLTAAGAGSTTRRTLTAATAGALALLGAVLGTGTAYVAALAYAWDNPLDGLSGLSSVPARSLLLIVLGMPLLAAAAGWLLAGREPPAIARRPLE